MADQVPQQGAAPQPTVQAAQSAAAPTAPSPQSEATVSQGTVPAQTAAPGPSAVSAGTVDDDEKFFAALGYFAFLFVLPLIVKPKSAYCKFHARQSMVLFLITILVLIVLASVPMIGSLLTLALFAVYVLAIYKSYKGELWAIPLISQFAGKMNVEALYGKAGLAVSSISGLKEKAEGLTNKAGEAVKNIGKQDNASTPPQEPPKAPAV